MFDIPVKYTHIYNKKETSRKKKAKKNFFEQKKDVTKM
jgi:hypothetical protein